MPWDILDYEGRTVGDGAAFMPLYSDWYNQDLVVICNRVVTGCSEIIPCLEWWDENFVVKCDKIIYGRNEVIPCQI